MFSSPSSSADEYNMNHADVQQYIVSNQLANLAVVTACTVEQNPATTFASSSLVCEWPTTTIELSSFVRTSPDATPASRSSVCESPITTSALSIFVRKSPASTPTSSSLVSQASTTTPVLNTLVIPIASHHTCAKQFINSTNRHQP